MSDENFSFGYVIEDVGDLEWTSWEVLLTELDQGACRPYVCSLAEWMLYI